MEETKFCGVKNYSVGAERCERGKYFRNVFINIYEQLQCDYESTFVMLQICEETERNFWYFHKGQCSQAFCKRYVRNEVRVINGLEFKNTLCRRFRH